MSNKTKKLVALLAVFCVLLGAYLVLNGLGESTKDEEEPQQSATQTQTYTVLQVVPETLAAYSYTYNGEEYAYRLAQDRTYWIWDGDQTLPLDNGEITAMIVMVQSVTSTYKYENVAPESIADYGLGDDCVRMTFTSSDGTTTAVRFGKTNVFNGMTYFCREDDMSTVYMVASYIAPCFELTPQDIVSQDSLPAFAQTQLKAFRMTVGELSVLCDYDYPEGEEVDAESVRVMTAYENDGDGTVLEDALTLSLVDTLVGLGFGEAVTFDPARWEEYGVGEQPRGALQVFYTYTHKVTDSETGATTSTELQTMYELFVGEWTEDGRVWVRLKDCNGVYAVDLSTVLSLVGE